MKDVTRESWVARTSEENVKVADLIFKLLNDATGENYEPGYTNSFIGVRKDGKPCNFMTISPKKKGVGIAIRVAATEEFEDAICYVSGDWKYENGWYIFKVDSDVSCSHLLPVVVQASKEFGSKRVVDQADGNKYWIFIHADQVRAYVSDEETAMQNFQDDYEGFEGGLAEAVEEVGESSFVQDYMGDDYRDYFTRVYKVGVVRVESNRELSEYYNANGNGFDYVEYEDGYGSCYEDEELSPRDFNGLLGWQENSHNISVYELEADDFDIENLDINKNYVYYDGDELDQINVDGDEGDITLYLDGCKIEAENNSGTTQKFTI